MLLLTLKLVIICEGEVMELLYIREVIEAVGGLCPEVVEDRSINQVSTDSRKVETGNLYIALVGETFDGHHFIETAIAKGAAAILASKPITSAIPIPIIQVEDTLKALWRLATYYREKLAKPVIAITGSVGKTSTKDMIATILSAKYAIHKSQGNFNNHIGMPLTILGLENKHDAIVVEMGMRGFGEISALTHIAKPTIAVITNIGLSHIERLGSQDNILKAKLEIVEGLAGNGLLILNANDPYLAQVDHSIANKVVTIGVDTSSNYQAYAITDLGEEGISFQINLKDKTYEVLIPSIGKHNVYNALFGIACGMELGMDPEEIIEGIKKYQPEKMRLNLIEKDGIKFINDAYNASPDSMKAALQVLASLSKNNDLNGSKSIAILGNMFELGHMSSSAHFNVGEMCLENNIDFTAIIGENAQDIAQGISDPTKYKIFSTHEEIVHYMKNTLTSGDIVLIKGSRGMKMERILELW